MNQYTSPKRACQGKKKFDKRILQPLEPQQVSEYLQRAFSEAHLRNTGETPCPRGVKSSNVPVWLSPVLQFQESSPPLPAVQNSEPPCALLRGKENSSAKQSKRRLPACRNKSPTLSWRGSSPIAFPTRSTRPSVFGPSTGMPTPSSSPAISRQCG